MDWSLVQRTPTDWRVVVCDQETSKTRRLKAATGLWKIQPQWVVTPGKQTLTLQTFLLTNYVPSPNHSLAWKETLYQWHNRAYFCMWVIMQNGLAVQKTQVCSTQSRVSFETFFAEKKNPTPSICSSIWPNTSDYAICPTFMYFGLRVLYKSFCRARSFSPGVLWRNLTPF
jgi:hypothetical protein